MKIKVFTNTLADYIYALYSYTRLDTKTLICFIFLLKKG